MSSLNNFIANIKTEGLAKSNRFVAKISIPGVLNGTFQSNTLRKLELYCEAVQLPGMSVSTQQARTFGEFREMPYERLYENVSLTFLIDNSFDIKMFFDTWINSIQNPETRSFAFYNDYISDIEINVLNSVNEAKYYTTLYECYPKSISAIQLDYNSKDIIKFQVSINYRYWKSGTFGSSQNENQSVIKNGEQNLYNKGGPTSTTLTPQQQAQNVLQPGLN